MGLACYHLLFALVALQHLVMPLGHGFLKVHGLPKATSKPVAASSASDVTDADVSDVDDAELQSDNSTDDTALLENTSALKEQAEFDSVTQELKEEAAEAEQDDNSANDLDDIQEEAKEIQAEDAQIE